MDEKIIFEDWMKDIRTWNEPIIHVIIVEDDMAIKLYENGILKRRRLKGKDK